MEFLFFRDWESKIKLRKDVIINAEITKDQITESPKNIKIFTPTASPL